MVVCVSLFLFESVEWFKVEYFTFSCLHVPYIEYHWQVLLPKVQHPVQIFYIWKATVAETHT